ncbi:3-keto-5-aminohexanoate cleavage protein [Candidatus Bathyarchaeota archaeon]|nr:3-keto-5-aminohexanoate cleavage protein [Candidatus Bathyarchaeota archaeon]MBS7630692.1 3-keto-5-aminohexanoate cleavage protein [Candidatus Bathyarchaeota archaeon]
METEKLIITAAVTGGEYVSKATTPYVPSTVDEIVEEVVRSVEAGASIVHLHAKDPATGEAWSGDPNPLLKEYIRRIRERIDVVINISTGGGRVGNPPEKWDELVKERCRLGAEMMSLNMGTMNRWAEHPTGPIFLNTVEMIERWCGFMVEANVKPEHEIYDTGMINICKQLAEKRIVLEPLHVQLVMVGRTGILPTPKALLYCLDQLPQGWTWSVCALGRNEIPMAAIAMAMGGHVRVGFEDNIYLRRNVLAKSNSELVRKVVNIAKELDRPIATPDDAREILKLKTPI